MAPGSPGAPAAGGSHDGPGATRPGTAPPGTARPDAEGSPGGERPPPEVPDPPEGDGPDPSGTPRGPWARRLRAALEAVAVIGLALGAVLVVKATVAQVFHIPSSSMEPQLRVGDRVLVSRLAYRLHDPNRGDIVVFRDPRAAPPPGGFRPGRLIGGALEALGLREPEVEVLIKRVVGLPGETVEGRDGGVWVDGRLLVEPYLPPGVLTGDFGPVTVPSGSYFVLGDNRGSSADSRRFGPVPVSRIIGRAVLIIWPPWRMAFL